ncbi:MAG TPA: PAS domain-containing sensor histidine kinase [Puia sp.]
MSTSDLAFRFNDNHLNGLKTATVITDRNLDVIYCSPNTPEIIAIDREKESLSFSKIVETLSLPVLKDLATKITRDEEKVIEKEAVLPNGTYCLLNISKFQVGLESNILDGVVISISDITPLRTLENNFRTLSNVIPQLIWTNDIQGNANYFNSRWYEYSGLNFEKSYGLGWQAMVHPDDSALSVEKWKKALIAGEMFDVEYRLRRRDGQYRWHIGRNVPFRNSSGIITGWYGTATDVDDLKKIETSLRNSEEELRVTLESAIDYAIITTDINGIIKGWSAGAERIFGYTPNEVIGKSCEIIFTPEDRLNLAPETEMRQAREFGCASDERWHLRKDGSRFFMSGVMSPIQSRVLTGYVKVARDLTSKREFDQKLQNSEERYRIALDAAEMIAWDYDVLKDKIVWNNEMEISGDYPSENRLSLFLSFVHAQDKKYVEGKMQEALNHTGMFQAEFRINSPYDGSLKWMNSYGKTLRNENNDAYRLVGVMYDITNRKKLEQQKEEFIGIASHELKTPLTSIKAYAEVLEEILTEKKDGTSIGLISKLNAQVGRLEDLIKDLLDTTKISEGLLPIKPKLFDLRKLITDLVEEFRVISPKHHLKTMLQNDATVYGDPDLITQVMTNLISNAMKYSPKGGDVIITAERLPNGMKVSIQDFGIGIPESLKTKIFERFFRVSTSGVHSFPGMGLGLYIAAGIIHRHNGTISVESEEGKGSTFYFILPHLFHY